MEIRGKVSTNDGGSHGRALSTVVHGAAREFRRQGERVQGRGRRGNGGRTSNGNNISSNSNNSSGGINSNGNSHGGSSAGVRKVYAGEVAATNPSVEVEDGVRILAKTTGDVAGTAKILPSMGGTTAPSAFRMRLKMPRNRQMSFRSLLHGLRGSR